MTNLTEDGNHTPIQALFCTAGFYGMHQKIYISAINIPLSVAAFLGNALIIAAFQKVSSIHPPSKLLLQCLAITDLCVGLLTQPIYVSYLMLSEHAKHCYYLSIILYAIGGTFCGVSCLTLTTVSVDRLLALILGLRYRRVVTLRRVRFLFATFWLGSGATAMILFYDLRIVIGIISVVLLLCIFTSTFCYAKIYHTLRHQQTQVQDHLHQGQPNGVEIPLNIARYRKTVSSALWVQIALLACYLPYGMVAGLIFVSGSQTPSLYFALDVTVSLLYFNSTLNPFLYCWKIRVVGKAVKDTIRRFCCL
ncbi:adenosine receptor A3-like [Oculina patagonica]